MKRFALLVAALAVMASGFAAKAADDVEFKNSGEFRVRYSNYMNSTGQEASGQKAGTHTRFKLNISARKGDKFQAFLGLAHVNVFGYAAPSGTGRAGTDTVSGTTINTNNTLLATRAWGFWKASDMVSLKVGRFGLEVADGSVLAENDWEYYPVWHDGALVVTDTSFATLVFAATKVAELTPSAGKSSDPEENVYGVVADLKNMPEFVKMANVTILADVKDEEAAGARNVQHVSVHFGGDVSNVLYKVTAAMQSGILSKTAAAEVKQAASMYDLMVGYQMPDMMGSKITFGYHMDSGNTSAAADKSETYMALYYDAHNYGGLQDVVRWGNLTYMNVNASMKPMDDLEVGLGYYMFSRTSDKDTTNPFAKGRYATALGTTTDFKADAKDIGSELDLYANKSYEGGLKMGFRVGMFTPGAFMKDGSVKHDKPLMEAGLQASLAF